MAFTTNLSGTTELDNSLVLAFDQSYIIAAGQNNVMDAFITKKVDIGAKSIQMTKYSRLSPATTPLTETEDVTSDAMADAAIILTPAEYGKVVTTTQLANLQTGGKADMAAAEIIGINHAETLNALAVQALDLSSNVRVIAGTAEGSVTAGQVMDLPTINFMYNKLARASVPKVNGEYTAFTHDDVLLDLRAGVSAGAWTDVTKYANPGEALNFEVGMYGGFRWVRNNAATFADQTGAGTVDLYNTYFLGFNALGKATSNPGHLTITGPFDKLGRFLNIGWYEVSKYGIIDQDALWVAKTASSVGANA